MATGRALLDLLDLLEREQLREAATAVYTNFSNPELELYAAVRALEESEAEIEARPAPFPASLPPWLVMQWLPIREVPAALRVTSWWRGEAEQYFCRFAQYHGLIRVDSWQVSVRCYMHWYRFREFTDFQKRVFSYYIKHWAESDSRFIPIEEVAAIPGATVGRVKTTVALLVSLRKVNASPTGQGHRFDFQIGGLEALTPLQQRVLKYHIVSFGPYGRTFDSVAEDLRIDDDQLFDAVDFLESEGWLTSLTEVNEEYYHWATNRYLYGLAPLQQRVNDCHVAIHLQPHVLDYYTKFATSDEGLHSNAVAAALRIDLPELRAAVNFLASEGHLYATIDEDHHKSAECVLYTEPDD